MDEITNLGAHPDGEENSTPSSPSTPHRKDIGSSPAPPPVIPHDVADKVLSSTGERSIHQTIRRLNNKQRLVVELMLSGIEPDEALARAGYASRGPLETIQRKMPDLMDRVGLTDEYLINSRLKPLLDADQTQFFQTTQEMRELVPKESGGHLEVLIKKELIIEERVKPALDIRLKALDMAFKLRGDYAARNPDGLDDPGTNGQPQRINVNIIHVGGA